MLVGRAGLVDWRRSDLRERIRARARLGTLRAWWTFSHLSAEKCRQRGLPEARRVGNQAARRSAGEVADARA
eukprot:11162156-Lingulodinium_polyedra.AAC.1